MQKKFEADEAEPDGLILGAHYLYCDSGLEGHPDFSRSLGLALKLFKAGVGILFKLRLSCGLSSRTVVNSTAGAMLLYPASVSNARFPAHVDSVVIRAIPGYGVTRRPLGSFRIRLKRGKRIFPLIVCQLPDSASIRTHREQFAVGLRSVVASQRLILPP